MRNIHNLHFEEDIFQQEYERVSRYYNIKKRSIPSPYQPPENKILSETVLLRYIKCNESPRALSIYLHIPFCDRKCIFCDLYSFHIPVKNRYTIEDYVCALEHEINFWGQLVYWRHRPVTTVHFGGGSPLILSAEQLNRLIKALKWYFNIDNKTEIAVEITTSQITKDNILLFKQFNITRVHIGVQTLSDVIRKIIGRKESASVVIEKLKSILTENFIISFDILYGLPLQTLQAFKEELNELIDLGVDGFALYELQISRAMNNIIKKNPAYHSNKALNYKMLLTGKKILNDATYKNVFFNHYGNPRDKNLYFTFPQRGEDCLAIGTIADAQLGKIFFRHKKYKKYLNSIAKGTPGIDYGYVEDETRSRIRKLETYLMSTSIPAHYINYLNEFYGHSFKGIFDLWKEAGLIRKNNTMDFELTGSGCWLLSSMIEQTRRLI